METKHVDEQWRNELGNKYVEVSTKCIYLREVITRETRSKKAKGRSLMGSGWPSVKGKQRVSTLRLTKSRKAEAFLFLAQRKGMYSLKLSSWRGNSCACLARQELFREKRMGLLWWERSNKNRRNLNFKSMKNRASLYKSSQSKSESFGNSLAFYRQNWRKMKAPASRPPPLMLNLTCILRWRPRLFENPKP